MKRTRILMALAAVLIICPLAIGTGGCKGGSGAVQFDQLTEGESSDVGEMNLPGASVLADAIPADEAVGMPNDPPALLCAGDEAGEGDEGTTQDAGKAAFKCFSCTGYLPASAPAVEAVMTANVAPIEEALGDLVSTSRLDPLRLGFYQDKEMRAQVDAICGACVPQAPAATRLLDRALDLFGPREAYAMMSIEGRLFSYARRCSDFVVLYRTAVDAEKALQQLGVNVVSTSVDEDGGKVYDAGNMLVKRQGAFIVAGVGKMFWEAIANIRTPPATCPFEAAQKQLGLNPKTSIFIGATAESFKLGYRHEVVDKVFAAMKISEILQGATKFATSFAGAIDAGEMPRLSLAIAGKAGSDILRLVVEGTYELLRAAASLASSTESAATSSEKVAVPEQETSSTTMYEKTPIEYSAAPTAEVNTAPQATTSTSSSAQYNVSSGAVVNTAPEVTTSASSAGQYSVSSGAVMNTMPAATTSTSSATVNPLAK